MESNAAKTYSRAEALKALNALREAAGLPPEQFPIQAFVGMISDEVESLRGRGRTDDEIAALIRAHSAIDIQGDEITANYASPEERHRGGEEMGSSEGGYESLRNDV